MRALNISIRHIGIVVNDLEESLKFWQDLMHFNIVTSAEEKGEHLDRILELENVVVKTIKLASYSGEIVELLKFPSHPDSGHWNRKTYSTGLTHIAVTVEDINLLVSKLRAQNFRIHSDPKMSPDGKVLFTYFRGPENLIIEAVEVL